MSERVSKEFLLTPPYRVVPESARRIQRTQLILLLFPAAAGCMFFGTEAVKLMLAAGVAAGGTEFLIQRVRRVRVPGSVSHSIMMGLLLAFMLPAHCGIKIAIFGAVAAVVVGKQFFGGLGHYVWHPALVGRLVVQIFFSDALARNTGPLLSRNRIFLGDINEVGNEAASWFRVDWFQSIAPPQHDGWNLLKPVEALRGIDKTQFTESTGEMSRYLLDHLPSLEHCVLGATPGGIGETCSIILILVGLYFMYRGYVPWKMPAVFLGAAYLGAMLLPIVVENPQTTGGNVILFPFPAGGPAMGLTYVHYQIFSGGLILGAMVLAGDMTSRPITTRGQVVFAAGAGFLTIIFRLYTPMAIPCYAAILVMNSLTSTIDRLTRPRGRRLGIREA